MKTNPMSKEKFEAIVDTLRRASQHYLTVFLIHRHRLSIIILALFCSALSAQSFEKINGLGKRYSFVIDALTNTQTQLQETSFNGHQMANYYSNEFGLVGYVFKKGRCFKMVLPVESVHTYNLTGLKVYEGQIYYKGHSKKVTIVENL